MEINRRAEQVALIAKPQLSSERTKRISALVLRTLVFAAAAKEGNLGFVRATHGSIAKYCSLTIKQVRLALSRLEAGTYIVKERCAAELGIVIMNFSEQRRCFGVVDDPEIIEVTPEGMLPVLRRGAVEERPKGGSRGFMGSLPN